MYTGRVIRPSKERMPKSLYILIHGHVMLRECGNIKADVVNVFATFVVEFSNAFFVHGGCVKPMGGCIAWQYVTECVYINFAHCLRYRLCPE